MALRIDSCPPDLLTEVARGVAQARGSAAGASAKQPMPLHIIGPDDVSEGFAAAAPRNGWRVLVDLGPALADLHDGPTGARFASLTTGAIVDRFLAAASVVAAVAENAGGTLSVIEIPALHMAAIRLSGSTPSILPYADPDRRRECSVDPEWEARAISRLQSRKALRSAGGEAE